ncbi:MAG: hypothetical protein QM762_23880 [Chryseolinea sp.]
MKGELQVVAGVFALAGSGKSKHEYTSGVAGHRRETVLTLIIWPIFAAQDLKIRGQALVALLVQNLSKNALQAVCL